MAAPAAAPVTKAASALASVATEPAPRPGRTSDGGGGPGGRTALLLLLLAPMGLVVALVLVISLVGGAPQEQCSSVADGGLPADSRGPGSLGGVGGTGLSRGLVERVRSGSPYAGRGTLRIRPVFHRLEERIRAHVLICWLALLLVRIAERETGKSWRKMRAELERIKLVTLQGTAGTVEQTTPLSRSQSEILAALDVEPPPTVTSLEPS